jgi:hypothetical protein
MIYNIIYIVGTTYILIYYVHEREKHEFYVTQLPGGWVDQSTPIPFYLDRSVYVYNIIWYKIWTEIIIHRNKSRPAVIYRSLGGGGSVGACTAEILTTSPSSLYYTGIYICIIQ